MDQLDRLKEGVKWMWALGDYAAVARLLEPCAIDLARACGVTRGMTVLDVAAGNGNFALAVAALGAEVTACDVTPRMVELGRARTAQAGAAVEWIEADAEDLPFSTDRFELVASVFGAMFAPRPERAAAEMVRVCRRGGRIAMANYSWDGFLGSYSKLLTRFSAAPPPDLPSPFGWGDPGEARSRFSGLASDVEIEPAVLSMKFDSVEQGFDFWKHTNGPTIALKAMLSPDRYEEFARDGQGLMREMNRSRDGHLELESSYIRVLVRK